MFKKINNDQSGMSLLEISIVMVVGALIIAAGLVLINAVMDNANDNQRRSDVQAIIGAMVTYKANNSANSSATPDDLIKILNSQSVDLGHYQKNTMVFDLRNAIPGNIFSAQYSNIKNSTPVGISLLNGRSSISPAFSGGIKFTVGDFTDLPNDDQIHIWQSMKCSDNGSGNKKSSVVGHYGQVADSGAVLADGDSRKDRVIVYKLNSHDDKTVYCQQL